MNSSVAVEAPESKDREKVLIALPELITRK